MVSARHDEVLAVEAVEPLSRFTILAQKSAVSEISRNHNYVRIKVIDFTGGLFEYRRLKLMPAVEVRDVSYQQMRPTLAEDVKGGRPYECVAENS